MDAKRILIFVALLVILGLAMNRACYYWRIYNPRPTITTAPAPAPGTPAQP